MSSVLRGVGRVALWVLLGLLLLRGVLATAASPMADAPVQSRYDGVGQAEQAFAIRFARTYLADPSALVRGGYLADGARLGRGRPPRRDEVVAQAEVEAIERLGGGRFVLTVACELRGSRTLYLAVPIARSGAGGVAALGAPSLVAGPGAAGVRSDRPRPLSGAGAAEIAALVRRFVPEYLGGASPEDLSYFLAPGTALSPLGGGVSFLSFSGVGQIGSGEGARRTVLAAVRVKDRSGGVYPLAYRLELVRGARWYVSGLQGALA